MIVEKKIGTIALILALLAIAAAGDVSRFWTNVQGQPQLNESVTFIPGQNIALTQDTANKTITIIGAATWSLSGLTVDTLNVSNILGINGEGVIGFTNTNVKVYYFTGDWNNGLAEIQVSNSTYAGIRIRVCNSMSSCYNFPAEIQVLPDTITLTGTNEINLNGNVKVNGKDIEQELVKTSIKSFQADYLNSSQILSDTIIIPQNINLTNITIVIENSINTTNFTLNFSLERFINYPTTKEIIFSSSFNQSVNYLNNLQYSFNNNDILLLNYTAYINVSKSSSMFKFKVW